MRPIVDSGLPDRPSPKEGGPQRLTISTSLANQFFLA